MSLDCRLSGNSGGGSFCLTGTASVSDGRDQQPVDVVFDLARGRCSVTPSSNNGSADGLYWQSDKVHLLDVDVRPPGRGRRFRAEKLGPFMMIRAVEAQADRDSNIADSAIAQALGIDSATGPLKEIHLSLLDSRMDFGINELDGNEGTELLYRCLPPRGFDIEVDVAGSHVRIHTFKAGSALAEYVRCETDSAVSHEQQERLRVALSLFFRRRAFWHVGRHGKKVRMNLTAPDQALSYGALAKNPKRFKETIQRLFDIASARNWYFLVEAFSNPGTLEVRMLNAMGHLEVVTGSYQLSWQTLANHFGVNRCSAEVIKEFRNRLIHDGRGMKHAMQRARDNLAQKATGAAYTNVLDQAFQTESPHHHFYCALMDLFSINLSDGAEIPRNWIKRQTALSFL